MVAKIEYLNVVDSITQAVGDDWNERRARLFIAVRIKSLQKALRDIEADLRFEKAVAERVSETFLQSFRYLREEKDGS